MRCEKMHATISVAQCLKNQRKLAGVDGSPHVKSLRYPGCQDCATGARARAGELHDDDWRALLAGYRDRRHPPEDVVTVAEQREQSKEESMEEAKKKQCIKCGKTKPLDRFTKEKRAKDGHRNLCLECNKVYQRAWRAKKDAKLVAAAAQGARKRHQDPLAEPAAEGLTAPVPRQETPAASHVLTLDFSVYPEVLEEIKHLAAWEERPPEVQARLMLRRLLRPGTDERRRALNNGERYQPMFLAADPELSAANG